MTGETPTPTKQTYEYEATVNRVVDGDSVYLNLFKTFGLDVDFGFHIKDRIRFTKTATQDFRLADIDAPEVVGANKVKGIEAKAALTRMLELGPLRVVSHGKDKYGRWLGTIFVMLPDKTELNVNQAMVDEGFAVVYTR
jgi:endonuclease YncB( thermonuclease family)